MLRARTSAASPILLRREDRGHHQIGEVAVRGRETRVVLAVTQVGDEEAQQ